MARISSKRSIPCPARQVFQAAKDVERFPGVMPDLNNVTILEDDGNGNTVTKWEATVAVGPLKRKITWTEKDKWDDEALVCTFDLIEGDMKTYEGTWVFSETDSGCDVGLEFEFELGIPMLGQMVNNIVNQIMQDNCDALLEALERLSAEAG